MSEASSTTQQKVCCSCGESVSGKKRLKDEFGQYWCIPCAERQERKTHGDKVQCPDCHRWIREDAMIAVELTRVCPTCHRERLALAKKNPTIRNARYDAEYRKHELKKLKIMGWFALGLVILGLWKLDWLPDMGRGESELRQLMWGALMLGMVAVTFLIGIVVWVRKNL